MSKNSNTLTSNASAILESCSSLGFLLSVSYVFNVFICGGYSMEDIERSNLARTIKKYRKARKLTMEQLSEKSGINLSTLKKYETDNRNPKLEQLSKIAEAIIKI